MDKISWDTIGDLVGWLDDKSPAHGDTATLLRVLKLSEEVGEVAEAVHGAMGANPRKGVSAGGWADVETELCDVIVTAMVALRSLTPDAQKLFDDRLRMIAERSLTGPPEPAEPN